MFKVSFQLQKPPCHKWSDIVVDFRAVSQSFGFLDNFYNNFVCSEMITLPLSTLPVASGSKMSIFLRYTHITPLFWGKTDPTQGILARKSVFCYRTPDFVNGPFVALDDIFELAPSDRFLVAVRRAVFRPPGRILPRKNEPVQVWAWFGSELRRNGRLSVGPRREQMAKTPFSLYKHPQNGYSPLIIW